MAPLVVIPVLILASLVKILTKMHRQAASDLVKTPARVRPTDPRVWPYLVAGFGLFASLGFINVLMGFLVQDRLGLASKEAGPTLAMRREEYGAMAGLIGATNGLTFVVAPIAGTSLYGVAPLLPIFAGVGMCLIVVVFVMLHPRFRQAGAKRAS